MDTPIKRSPGGFIPPDDQPFVIGKSWFLGIGIDTYAHWRQLNNAVRDMEVIYQLLVKEYDVDPDHSLIIRNEEATEDGIIRHLQKLVDEVEPIDKVLIYYSGHGHLSANGKRGSWVPQDADKDSPAKYVRNSTILEYLEDIDSLHTLLITDACFSGSLFRPGGASRGDDLVMEEMESKSSRWALCSGRHDQEVMDGPSGGNSPFADALLKILSENQADLLNIGKVVDQVISASAQHYKIQSPLGNPINVEGHDWGGEYIFRRQISDDLLWKHTQKQDTLAAYSNYILKSPNGKYIEQANQAVEYIQEVEAWMKVSLVHQRLAYQSFLNQFPEGKYQPPASILLNYFNNAPKSLPEELVEAPAVIEEVIMPGLNPNPVEEEPFTSNTNTEGSVFEDFEEVIGIDDDALEALPGLEESEIDSSPAPSRPEEAPDWEALTAGFCVILDAGHGGIDQNGHYVSAPNKLAVHPIGDFHKGSTFYEGAWNRKMLERIAKVFTQAGIPIMVVSNQVEDTSVKLRANMANRYAKKYNRSLFISIHTNFSRNPLKRGFEVYYASKAGEHFASLLAKQVHEQMGELIAFKRDPSNVLRKARFYLLLATGMPAILVEHLYYSNLEDAKLLMEEEVLDQFAQAYLEMVKAHLLAAASEEK